MQTFSIAPAAAKDLWILPVALAPIALAIVILVITSLYLTDRNRAVYIPTTAGYSVVVSPADPDAFLAALTATVH